MNNRITFGGLILVGAASIWCALFVGGLINYPGHKSIYVIFSAVFLLLLTSGFYRPKSYGYLFLAVMLWLGFWLKLTVHLLVDYPFGESVGFFVGTPTAWDEVLWVATIGGMGAVAARLLYGLAGRPSSMQAQNSALKTPAWYPAIRKWMWACLISACVGLAIVNASLGIEQIGLVPTTILPWPLNAVVYWLLSNGLTLAIATLLWWDITLGRNVSLVVHFVLLEAFTSTVSILSRGLYIFHVVPQFFALFKNKSVINGWSRKNIVVACVVFTTLFVLTIPLVNTLRGFYYSKQSSGESKQSSAESASNMRVGVLAKFAVDRWVGLEGVMAVSAYPKKGVDLLAQGFMERGEIGKDTLYNEISRPIYLGAVDKSKFRFTEIPGAMAFLFYAGQLWVVVLGMAALVLALLCSEWLVFRLTSNPLVTALWGGVVANAVVQMGNAPRGLLIYFFEMSCGIAAIYFIQSKSLLRLLPKLGGRPNVKTGA